MSPRTQVPPPATGPAPTPRNSKLSAYYSTRPATRTTTTATAVKTNSTASPSVRRPPSQPPTPTSSLNLPTTPGRHAAINYATHLAHTLPLPDLMTRSATLRSDADRLATSLQASSRQYYTHLAASREAAQTARTVASRLVATPNIDTDTSPPSTPTTNPSPQAQNSQQLPPTPVSPTAPAVIVALSAYANRCTAVANRLQPARNRVDALEGAQRLTLLLQGSALLCDTLPTLLDDATSPLCTDATTARTRLSHAVRRAAAILPPLRTLSTDAPAAYADAAAPFAKAFKRLRAVMDDISGAIRARCFAVSMGDGDGDGGIGTMNGGVETRMEDDGNGHHVLTLKDAAQLCLLLDAPPDEIRDEFLRACGKWICNPRPTQAALRAAGTNSLSVARLHVVFAGAEVVPRLYEAAGWYAELFVKRTGDGGMARVDGNLDDFTVWVTGVVDDGVRARVGDAIMHGVLTEGNVSVMDALRQALRNLGREQGGGDGGNREEDDECGRDVRGRVCAVLTAVGEEGWQTVVERGRGEGVAKVEGVVRAIVVSGGDVDVERVFDTVKEVSTMFGKFSEGGEVGAGWSVDALVERVVARAAMGFAMKGSDGTGVGDSAIDSDKGEVGRLGRACMLCRGLSGMVEDSGVAGSLREGAEVLEGTVQRVAVERVGDILRGITGVVGRGIGEVGGVDGVADDVVRAVDMLWETNRVGALCGIVALRRAHDSGVDDGDVTASHGGSRRETMGVGGDGGRGGGGSGGGSGGVSSDGGGLEVEALLAGEGEGEGSVGRCVVRGWVEDVRRVAVLDVEGVRVLQAVASAVGDAVGVQVVREIGAAAAERFGGGHGREEVAVMDEATARGLAVRWGLVRASGKGVGTGSAG